MANHNGFQVGDRVRFKANQRYAETHTDGIITRLTRDDIVYVDWGTGPGRNHFAYRLELIPHNGTHNTWETP